jgi:N-acetylglucosaminyldiphosphoundecaprenol N-acetyl-beta-D-mannosaminyltransferase
MVYRQTPAARSDHQGKPVNPPPLPRFDVLGTGVTAVNLSGTVTQVDQWIQSPEFGHYVCVTGVHGVTEGMRNPAIQRIHNEADAVVPDGMPLVWLGRRQGHPSVGRVYGPDLTLAILEQAARLGWTSYFYGGAPGVADELKVRMEAKFSGLKVLGTFCPPFRPLEPAEETAILAQINRLQPDLLWIGLSTPKQEILMARWKAVAIRAKVMLGVGAAFDFHTGRMRQAPPWMQHSGLEWFFRLCMEPRRLGPRYLRNNPVFVWALFREAIGGKRSNQN